MDEKLKKAEKWLNVDQLLNLSPGVQEEAQEKKKKNQGKVGKTTK